ncbi:hypothetical protein ACFL4O_03525, partial [bacterium]
MQYPFKNNNLFRKLISWLLIVSYIVTVGHIGEVIAALGTSTSYTLKRGVFSEGGSSKTGTTVDVKMDVVGQSIVGKGESISYLLKSGFIYTLGLNPPVLTSTIPNFSWDENTSLDPAFDLDDYFQGESELSYEVFWNSAINVYIDTTTHHVSFSQAQVWYGTENILFVATDEENNTTESNEITLQVQGVENPPVLDFLPDVIVDETELVTITPNATDADNQEVTYSFTAPLNSTGTWQTGYTDAGIYNITVTATDTTDLTDTQDVQITVKNVNRLPILNPIADITVQETELVDVASKVIATDPDNEALSIYYTAPITQDGTWLTTYDDAGTYTSQVTVSDGIDTVSRDVNVIVDNVNRAPLVDLTLSKYTVVPEGKTTITLTATDPDNDSLIFTIKKDDVVLESGELNGIHTIDTSFLSMGDHTITASVIDVNVSALEVTLSKGVDVVDPNLDRNNMNPVMGDFDGDSFTDLGVHNSDTGKWEVAISDKGEFRNAVDWMDNFGTSKDFWPIGGDFNGDGRTDVGVYNNKEGELKVALSSGYDFEDEGT